MSTTGLQIHQINNIRYYDIYFYGTWQITGALRCFNMQLITHTPSSICTLSATESHLTIINDWIRQKLWAATSSSSNTGCVFPSDGSPQATTLWRVRRAVGCLSRCVPSKADTGALTHTGNGSAPSWMTKPSMTCVRTWGLTMAWGGLFSPFCGVLPVTVGASFSFPEVMAGGGVPGAALGLLVVPPPDQKNKMNTTPAS